MLPEVIFATEKEANTERSKAGGRKERQISDDIVWTPDLAVLEGSVHCLLGKLNPVFCL